jgi:hypothetical protein
LIEKVRPFVEKLFSQSDLNRLPEKFGGERIFATPLLGVARGDDPIFLKYREVVHPEHLTPAEMWIKNGLSDAGNPAVRIRTLSIIFPYEKRIRDENRESTEMPAQIYCVGRNFANAFIKEVLSKTVNFFQEMGYSAMAGVLSSAFQIRATNLERIASTWSERHIAFAAGLGTFSLHEGLITEAGCNIRVGSVITDAPLEVTPRRGDDPFANCLFLAGGKCKKCADRCPGKAISENGHDKIKCYSYGRVVEKEMNKNLGSILKPHPR